MPVMQGLFPLQMLLEIRLRVVHVWRWRGALKKATGLVVG